MSSQKESFSEQLGIKGGTSQGYLQPSSKVVVNLLSEEDAPITNYSPVLLSML